jgi:asparagine synthase (glutamine-hydrolysing)
VTSGLLDRAMVRRMIDDDRSGRADRSKEIWQLLTLELWRAQAAAPAQATPVPSTGS